MAGNGQMIIELDRKRMVAMAEKDIATLNALLADDLIYTIPRRGWTPSRA